MTVKTAQVTVGATATRLDVTPEADYRVGSAAFPVTYGQGIEVTNEGAADIRIGGADVAFTGATRGRLVRAGDSYSTTLKPGNEWWGIAATGTSADCTVYQEDV